jgi:ABC-type lipoprotein release transport system permease subunit
MRNWIEKQKNIVDFTLSSLSRRKGKNIALWLVYMFIVFILASVMFFAHALKREAAIVLQDAPEIVVQRVVAGRHEMIPIGYLEKLSGIRGVITVKPRLWGYYYYSSAKANYTVMAPDGFGHKDGNVMIGAGVARHHMIGKGEAMWFKASNGAVMKFTIAAMIPTESELLSSDLILMTAGDFRRLFGMSDGYATDFALTVRNPRELPNIAVKIINILPDTRSISRDEILRTYEAVFSWRQGVMMAVLFGALLAFVILAWDKASGLSAEEKKEIGILKAIGWETSDVLLLKFWEGAVVSLSAFAVGVLLAYIHVFFSSAMLFEPVLKGWSVLYPKFRLTPFISAYQVFTLFFLTVIPYTTATIVPSWKAASMDPDAQVRS